MLRKRGKYYHVKFKAGGITYQKSAGTTSIRQAEEFERELRAYVAKELRAKRTGKPVERTYSEAIAKWLETGAPESMLSHARNTLLYMADSPLQDCVTAASDMRKAMLKRKLSRQTINRRLAVVRRILNLAFKEWGWLSEPLGPKISLLSEAGLSREVYLTQEEVQQIVGLVRNMDVRKVLLIAAYTGLRRGELLRLTPANWREPYIHLTSRTKSGKARTVPLIEDLWDYMTLPFPVSESQLRDGWEEAREAMGRPEIRFHDLRHTFASWLAKDPSVPLTLIRDLLGHSNLSVTSKYAHLREGSFDLITSTLGEVKH